ncbi:MAG: class I SAM-dependent methyltransferase [Bacteroidota bacterium]
MLHADADSQSRPSMVVRGTLGYGMDVARFAEATQAIPFAVLHRAFLVFIPPPPSRILDVGAGIGRDASVLAAMGHTVVAVEPTPAFLATARRLYDAPGIQWVHDALPELASLRHDGEWFDFVLASAMWHHLDGGEQEASLARIATMLRPGGVVALSLRHGPAGVGTHVFPTDGQATIRTAKRFGLRPVLQVPPQPSLLPNKPDVTWTRLVFEKRA